MLFIPVYNTEGAKVETIEVSEETFGDRVKKNLLRQVILMYEANLRRGTAKTKTKSEVQGSMRKPWAQKHTGRARAGQIRSPIWRHGGIVFGPRPRSYYQRIPYRMKKEALKSALLAKLLDNEVFCVSELKITEPKTKLFQAMLQKLPIKRTCIIGIKNYDKNCYLASRNIPNVSLYPVNEFNAYNILKHKTVVFTKDAFNELLQCLGDKKKLAEANTDA